MNISGVQSRSAARALPISDTCLFVAVRLMRHTPKPGPTMAYSGNHNIVQVQPIGTGTASRAPRPDQLASVKANAGGDIEVVFADGRPGTIRLTDIGISAEDVKSGSWKVANSGTAASVKSRSGELFDIDSAVLRCCIDSEYADQLNRAIANLR